MIILKENKIIPESTGYRLISSSTFSGVIHGHEFYEFIIVLEGKLVHIRNGESGTVEKGEYMCIFPGEKHGMIKAGDSLCRVITVCVSGDLWKKWESIFPSGIDKLRQGALVYLGQEDLSDIIYGFDRILFSSEDASSGRLFSVLGKLFCVAGEKGAKRGEYEKQRLINLLHKMDEEENLREGMPALMRLCGYSRSHLYKILKPELGKTPHEFITERRMIRAKRLLEYTDYSILEISMDLGFKSVSHFISAFSSFCGETPLKYRKRLKKPIV